MGTFKVLDESIKNCILIILSRLQFLASINYRAYMKNKLPSNRKFGLLFAIIFLILAIYDFINTGFSKIIIFYFLFSLVFLIISIIKPELLSRLNEAWFLLSQFMGKIISPVVLGIIFFGLLTPIALITKLFARDELKLHRSSGSSYWTRPSTSSFHVESFKNQF